MPKPFISIGIIFKNEIRCLERCLRSLAPLREAIPCELVMADTGSSDGSREVAEKYADILFDFPWINDFSAARNAVMDRCTGRWYLSLDADEWLDADLSELVTFVRANNSKTWDTCMLRIRNYMTEGDGSDYSDFFVSRMLRMSTGLRYQGAIHELWKYDDGRLLRANMLQTILHHDGYVGLNTGDGEAKRKRNQALLREELEKDPENIRHLLQYIESSRPDDDHIDYIRRGLDAVEKKLPEWNAFGPVIYRYAILCAHERDLPEIEEWIRKAEELFPNSFYTQIDISFHALFYFWKKEEYSTCVRYGEQYLKAIADYDAGRGDQAALMVSTLQMTTPRWRSQLSTLLALSYVKTGQPERGVKLLVEIEPLDGNLVGETIKDLWEMQISTNEDTTAYMLRLYQRITEEPDEKKAGELMIAFLQTAPLAFGPDVREKEASREDFHRYSYTVFLPLAGKCEAGTAAAVMETASVQEMDGLLETVGDWSNFSVSALLYALEQGAAFPPDGRAMGIEEMDRIAKRLSQYKGRFVQMAAQTAPRQCGGSWQRLVWARCMVLTAVQDFSWGEEELGFALAKAFAKVEGAFVSRCYTEEALLDENIQVLPPLHRFGWYCSKAFETLKKGDMAGYVRFLRTGLESCPQMKVMAEFLMQHTPQLKPPASGELLALAEKVRSMLAAYPADDPAVAMLKQSAAYQKVAHLIEGPEPGLFGGLKQ